METGSFGTETGKFQVFVFVQFLVKCTLHFLLRDFDFDYPFQLSGSDTVDFKYSLPPEYVNLPEFR